MAIKLARYDSAEYLKDDEAIIAYLQEALETGEPAMVSHALGVVARARGMAQIAREAGVSRENLYRALSDEGNPELGTVMKVMNALGMKLSAAPLKAMPA